MDRDIIRDANGNWIKALPKQPYRSLWLHMWREANWRGGPSAFGSKFGKPANCDLENSVGSFPSLVEVHPSGSKIRFIGSERCSWCLLFGRPTVAILLALNLVLNVRQILWSGALIPAESMGILCMFENTQETAFFLKKSCF